MRGLGFTYSSIGQYFGISRQRVKQIVNKFIEKELTPILFKNDYMTKETAEKKAIKEYLKLNGWFVYHNLAGLGCYAGLADLTAIKDGIVLQIEVKVGNYKQSLNQIIFQQDWENNGGYYVCGNLDTLINYLKEIYVKKN